MKEFLDFTCQRLNETWDESDQRVADQVDSFQAATRSLIDIFGVENIARKQDSRSFNRAIFDALAFYAADARIREAMMEDPTRIRQAYATTLDIGRFAQAVESDTAGVPNTQARLEIWGAELKKATQLEFNVPTLEAGRVQFLGLR